MIILDDLHISQKWSKVIENNPLSANSTKWSNHLTILRDWHLKG